MNKEGEWLVQCILLSTKLNVALGKCPNFLGTNKRIAIGKYPNKEMAIAAAYLALATCIEKYHDVDTTDFYLTPLCHCEDNTNLAIFVMNGDKMEIACTLVKIVGNDKELWP